MSKQQSQVKNLETLVQVWSPKIYGLALRLTCQPHEAEDIAQETFLRAIEHWQDFREDSEVGTWLYRICVNVWKNQVRASQRRSFWERLSVLHLGFRKDANAEDLAAPDLPLDSHLEANDRTQQLKRALARLDPEDRAVLIMREIDDLSYEDISSYLGIPLGTVKSRLGRTRNKLKNLYHQ